MHVISGGCGVIARIIMGCFSSVIAGSRVGSPGGAGWAGASVTGATGGHWGRGRAGGASIAGATGCRLLVHRVRGRAGAVSGSICTAADRGDGCAGSGS